MTNDIFDVSGDAANEKLQRRLEGRVAGVMDRLIERERVDADLVYGVACVLCAAHFAARGHDALTLELRAWLHGFFKTEAERWNPLATVTAKPPA